MNKKKLIKKPYYECSSCEITTETVGRTCPCWRGSCDARHKGTVIITREIKLK
jgi:hypothetical protein